MLTEWKNIHVLVTTKLISGMLRKLKETKSLIKGFHFRNLGEFEEKVCRIVGIYLSHSKLFHEHIPKIKIAFTDIKMSTSCFNSILFLNE